MKKVRFNEESNIVHTFSSSFATAAANNEADHKVINEAEAVDVTKEALTSATANASFTNNDDTREGTPGRVPMHV
jgi:hypothetical protein